MESKGGGKHTHRHSHSHRRDPPESVVVEGTAKRNILRHGKPTRPRKADASGHVMEEILEPDVNVILDKDDPDYDSDAEDAEVIMTPTSEGSDLDIGTAKLTLTQYKRQIETIISEFFVSGDMNDFINSIVDIDCREYGYELVKRAINMSLDKGYRERELISKVLCYAHPDLLSSSIIGKGFERLFEIIDEVAKDVPGACNMLSKFLARAVVDEVLPPSFLQDPIVSNLGGEVVEEAKRMLSREHVGARLESCWGPGDGRPVAELKIAVDQLLQEYLLSRDINEVTRCVLELQAPHFYHEIVKRAVVQSMDNDLSAQKTISQLFFHLKQNGYLVTEQAVLGFNHLHDIVDDLALDTPSAKSILAEFTERAKADNVLPKDYFHISKLQASSQESSEIVSVRPSEVAE